LLGTTLVTDQTGTEGTVVNSILIEEGCDSKDEYYISFVVYRATNRVVLMGSEEGGTEIEKVKAKTPEKIFTEVIDPAIGLLPFQARRLAFNINIPTELINKAAKLLLGLYDVFVEKDASIDRKSVV